MATNSTEGRNACINGLTALLNNGKAVFKTAGSVTIATLTLGAPAFAAASGGSALANAITPDTNAIGGVAAILELQKIDNTVILTMSVGTSGTEIIMTSTTVGAGDRVSISSLTLSIPAS
jgi:hypothetical protein